MIKMNIKIVIALLAIMVVGGSLCGCLEEAGKVIDEKVEIVADTIQPPTQEELFIREVEDIKDEILEEHPVFKEVVEAVEVYAPTDYELYLLEQEINADLEVVDEYIEEVWEDIDELISEESVDEIVDQVTEDLNALWDWL